MRCSTGAMWNSPAAMASAWSANLAEERLDQAVRIRTRRHAARGSTHRGAVRRPGPDHGHEGTGRGWRRRPGSRSCSLSPTSTPRGSRNSMSRKTAEADLSGYADAAEPRWWSGRGSAEAGWKRGSRCWSRTPKRARRFASPTGRCGSSVSAQCGSRREKQSPALALGRCGHPEEPQLARVSVGLHPVQPAGADQSRITRTGEPARMPAPTCCGFPPAAARRKLTLGWRPTRWPSGGCRGMRGGRDGENGVAVLMRYTLRLLTLQQFQRAATLICACEQIRRSRCRDAGARLRSGSACGWAARRPPTGPQQSRRSSRRLRSGGRPVFGVGSPHQFRPARGAAPASTRATHHRRALSVGTGAHACLLWRRAGYDANTRGASRRTRVSRCGRRRGDLPAATFHADRDRG